MRARLIKPFIGSASRLSLTHYRAFHATAAAQRISFHFLLYEINSGE